MEHLWSRADATESNGRQTPQSRKRPSYLRTVADDCHRLQPPLHGKEGVDGSSPSEGLRSSVQARGRGSNSATSCGGCTSGGWSRFWVRRPVLEKRHEKRTRCSRSASEPSDSC